ncbi:hypothetical protein [Marixanthomonas spongiae]|uniref:tRNA (Guanine-N1)-methyltransferase n=1 Tax=Marixanthomonas spongiae TaxID=2174845 RepID=A0A2U0HYK8_9FLAO|nr:hypothetical protein [Marixanthomonas spongiae]PVW13927.1 hypothetical protein DDV96_12320 [Marixanthomonas spongiae]
MKKKLTALLPLFLCAVFSFAQENPQSQAKDNTLEGQFKEVVDESNNYQEYKVIKKYKINQLRKNILDSVAALESKIEASQSEIDQKAKTIDSLTGKLKTTKENLAVSKEKENGIEILGILTQKSTYNTIMWSIIVLLLVVLGFLFYKFKNSHKVTKASQLKLAETEMELETNRQKSLEREQKLRRKLQDEINKNRNK